MSETAEIIKEFHESKYADFKKFLDNREKEIEESEDVESE